MSASKKRFMNFNREFRKLSNLRALYFKTLKTLCQVLTFSKVSYYLPFLSFLFSFLLDVSFLGNASHHCGGSPPFVPVFFSFLLILPALDLFSAQLIHTQRRARLLRIARSDKAIHMYFSLALAPPPPPPRAACVCVTEEKASCGRVSAPRDSAGSMNLIWKAAIYTRGG